MIATIERALKDADNYIDLRGSSGQKYYDDIATKVKEQITEALMLLRKTKDNDERIEKLKAAAAPFIAVLEYQERSHQDGYRPPIDKDEYISVHSHITEKHFRALRDAFNEDKP